MRQMKNSGIEWIGDIPADWQVAKLKHSIRWKSVKGNPEGTVLSLYRDYGVIPKDSRDDNHNVTSLDTSTYKVVEIGDFVINKMKAWQGSMAVSEYNGIVSPAYHVCEITNPNIYGRYFHLLLRNPVYIPEYTRLSTGMRIGQWDLGYDDFKNIPFIIPPYEEQKRIADFLDRKCAEIDTVIEKTKTTIEEYKKLKQSVITEAVTKGIRGDRAMKDSGIEWIGEIPADWEITRVKNIATKLQKGNGITKEDVVVNGDTPCVRYGEIYTKYNQSFTECVTQTNKDIIGAPKYFTYGDILFTCTGELVEEIGKSIVYLGSDECLAGGDIIIMNHKQNPAFLNYVLSSAYAQAQKSCDKTKLKVVHISADDICNVVIALPPITEQGTIADYLDRKCAEIDKLMADKTHLLEEMESYKKSVIYEYVTGKKEV